MASGTLDRTDPLVPLARAALEGEASGLKAFLKAVAPMALRVVRQVLGADHPDVEDVLQEALLGALAALARFRGESSLAHFVRRIALLTALNARRRHQLREHLLPRAEWDDARAVTSAGSTPADDLDFRRLLSTFEALLDELPTAQAEVLALHCVLGHTVAETAELCQVPENTVRSRLATAKAQLRKRLETQRSLKARIRGAL
jgi:RNA polymerase sigma-70 factor (ECF subfamily)